ncbi:cell filamentation protein Fic [Spirochaetia bacterium]|nr:cell filamentation protein Fic [Spirochaetia bacterium]
MGKVYKYIDPDYTYTDPKTGVLWNLGTIADNDTLIFFESTAVTKRTKELEKSPVKIKDSATLFAIHRYLFQDVYTWAGQKRRVEIGKGGKQFFPLDHFDTALVYIDNLIAEYRSIDKNDSDKIAGKLAEILDTVNYLHPFREGNGRTQREFLRALALEKGYALNMNPADNADVYERYMSGTIDADVGKLADLILELMRGAGDE